MNFKIPNKIFLFAVISAIFSPQASLSFPFRGEGPLKDIVFPGDTLRFGWTNRGFFYGLPYRVERCRTASDGTEECFSVPVVGGFVNEIAPPNLGQPWTYKIYVPEGTKPTDAEQSVTKPMLPPPVQPGPRTNTLQAVAISSTEPSTAGEYLSFPLNSPWRIPDIISSQAETLYALVYMDTYISTNRFFFDDGNWTIGQTLGDLGLSVTNGIIPGIEGIWFATERWVPTYYGGDPTDPDASVTATYAPEGCLSLVNCSKLYSSTPGSFEPIIASHVPGPISVFGAIAGFGFSRKLRRRIKVAAN